MGICGFQRVMKVESKIPGNTMFVHEAWPHCVLCMSSVGVGEGRGTYSNPWLMGRPWDTVWISLMGVYVQLPTDLYVYWFANL